MLQKVFLFSLLALLLPQNTTNSKQNVLQTTSQESNRRFTRMKGMVQ